MASKTSGRDVLRLGCGILTAQLWIEFREWIWVSDALGRTGNKTMAINVRNLGALGNGLADDTVTLQNAIDLARTRGEPVFLPAGRYRTTRTLRPRSNVDIFGEDASLSIILHDLSGLSANERRANATCLHLEDQNPQGDPGLVWVSLRRFSIHTTEPHLRLGDRHRQTGMYVFGGTWNCLIREVHVRDFYQGIFLRQCWTARLQNCSVDGAILHCLKWENATAGEITGCRLDSLRTSNGDGDACAYVTFAHVPEYQPTSALSVSNNSFQHSEEAGFKGMGVQNLTMANNFFENNNRADNSATAFLHLLADTANTSVRHYTRVVNVIGGHFFRAANGRGTAIRIENYDIVNLVGIEIDPHVNHRFSQGLHIIGNNSQVNIIGVHSRYPNSMPGTVNPIGSLLTP